MIRLALVGFGKWGRNYVQAARDAGNIEISAVVTRSALPLDQLPDGAVHAFSLGDVLDECDAVVVAAHPSAAPELCEIALAAGKPVMVEKPAGLSLAEAQRIKDAETASNAFVLVAHQHLFARAYEDLRDMGLPDNVTAVFTGPTAHDFSPRWDYGAHAAACIIGLGCVDYNWEAGLDDQRRALVTAGYGDVSFTYDGYAPAEPPLTRAVRAFADSVRAGGTTDWRFGADWATNVARVLEAASRL